MKAFRPLHVLAIALGLVAPTFAAERHVVVISIDGLPNYLLDDPQASLPVLRGLIARGVVAKGGMGVSNPSVTWPNHTTLMTGVQPERHGVIYNGLPQRGGPGVPVKADTTKTQREMVRVPMLFDVLKDAGRTSAAINWPCTRESSSVDDNLPGQFPLATPRLRGELESAGFVAAPGDGAIARDRVWTEATRLIVRERMPALLALHLGNLDGTHHRYGPKTPAGYTAAALVDSQVGQILDTIAAAGLSETTTVIIVSDHGFITAPKSIRPNVALRKAGLLEADGEGAVTKARAHVIPEGGIGMVYLTDPSTASADRETVRKALKDIEGVAAIFGPEEYPRYRLPSPEAMPQMADMVVACKDGYSIGASAAGEEAIVAQDHERGVHGYLSTEPQMRAVFIAAGAGVRRGVALDTMDNSDVAPTAAKILGIPLPGATGRVLAEILDSAD